MTKISLSTVLAIALATAGTARAGGQAGSIGVGAEFELNGSNIGGPSVNYDAGAFHVGGAIGFDDAPGGDNTVFSIGGRFYFHLHSTAAADFGIGGNLGLQIAPDKSTAANTDDHVTNLFLEPAFQVRAFITSNVALSFTGGVVIGVIDADQKSITGTLTGGAGIHYYFF